MTATFLLANYDKSTCQL